MTLPFSGFSFHLVLHFPLLPAGFTATPHGCPFALLPHQPWQVLLPTASGAVSCMSCVVVPPIHPIPLICIFAASSSEKVLSASSKADPSVCIQDSKPCISSENSGFNNSLFCSFNSFNLSFFTHSFSSATKHIKVCLTPRTIYSFVSL